MTTSDYVAGRVQEALAHAGETDVHVTIDRHRMVLTGTVATDARHDEVVALVRGEADGFDVVDDIAVVHVTEPEPGGQEAIT